MAPSFSIAKAGAIASTALLMGAYVWFQSNGRGPSVLSDTTTGEAVQRQPGGQPALLPGPKSAPAEIVSGNPTVLPGSKDWVIFPPNTTLLPGSKSDTLVLPEEFLRGDLPLFPGSKSGKVRIIPQTDPPAESPAPKPSILPGSKAISPVFNQSKLRIALEQAQGKEKSPPPNPANPSAIYSGSKSKVPLIPAPKKKSPPAVLPGSKYRSGVIDAQKVEDAINRVRKKAQKQPSPPVQSQK